MKNKCPDNYYSTNPRENKKRGSAIAAVFILCTVTAMVAGSALNTAVGERRMNQIAALNAEARNAAEAVVEFGLADLQERFTEHNSFSSDELDTANDPLTLPDAFYTLFSGSHIIMPDNPYDGTLDYGTYSTEIIGGTVPDAGWTFIDSTIPGNENDELADRNVSVRQVRVYGRATAAMNNDGTGMKAVAYCRESLQVRDAPLFSYAIFYNMNLEIAPGANMTITGPVHTNGNLYLAPNPTSTTSAATSSPSGSATLKFTDAITAVGGIYHTLPTGYNDIGSGNDYVTGAGQIYFTDKDSNLVSMYQSTRWITSAEDDWYDVSKDLWDERIQDKAYSVRSAQSVAFSDYVADDPSTTATYDALNYAYQIIMPSVSKNITTATTTSPAYDESVEQQKYVNKAGLVIVVKTGTIASGTVGITGLELYRQEFDTDGHVVYSGNAPKRTLLCSVTSSYGNAITATCGKTNTGTTSTFSSTNMNETVWGNLFGTPSTPGNAKSVYYTTPTGGGTATAGTGSVYAHYLTTSGLSSSENVTDRSGSGTTADPYRYYSNSGIFRIRNYSGSTSATTSATVTSGMWDMRRAEGLDIFEIDMGKLRDALLADNAYLWSPYATSETDDTYSARKWWNGIIYVEFPYDSSDTVGNDNVRKSADGYGLRLKDAQATISGSTYTPGIPGNMTASTYSSWKYYESLTGTTVVTNGAMYILGNYNADGDSTTGSSTNTDTSDDKVEPAASLAADSITMLSTMWLDYYSALSLSSYTSLSHRYNNKFLEVSAAMISGIVPTNKNGADHTSGGVHNLPRFLEAWSSATFCYRGSFVCLYESEIGSPAPYFRTHYTGTINYVYSAPKRDWGFNEQYSDGFYPPGTPLLRTFKQVDFEFLNASEWASEISGL
jgi:hypothetical protein